LVVVDGGRKLRRKRGRRERRRKMRGKKWREEGGCRVSRRGRGRYVHCVGGDSGWKRQLGR